jgi:hypothetical protein
MHSARTADTAQSSRIASGSSRGDLDKTATASGAKIDHLRNGYINVIQNVFEAPPRGIDIQQ